MRLLTVDCTESDLDDMVRLVPGAGPSPDPARLLHSALQYIRFIKERIGDVYDAEYLLTLTDHEQIDC